jgi:hypothetical protein
MINCIVNFLHSILPFWFILVLIIGAYGFMSNDDFINRPNQDVVTFKISCSTVLSDPMRYPEHIYEHCRKITSRR